MNKITQSFVMAVFLLLASHAFAQSTSMQIGLNNLLSTQNTDGSWGGTVSSTEILPVTISVMQTLQLLNQTNTENYSKALLWLQPQNLTTTDYLSERIYVLSVVGTDSDLLLSYIDDMANAWGGDDDSDVNNLDTALALLALKKINYTNQTTLNSAISYILSSQNSDGGFGFCSSSSAGCGDGGADSNIYMTALVSSTLQQFTRTTSIATAINKATAYLIAHQNAAGGFGTGTAAGEGGASAAHTTSTIFETAYAYIALVGATTDTTVLCNAINYLTLTQSPDGSWNGDPYSTALALRTLHLSENRPVAPPAPPTTGTITGKVTVAGSNQPLGGVTVVSGQLSVTSTNTGDFTLSNIAQGSQKITFSLSGYQTSTLTINITAGQTINIGTIPISSTPNTGIIKGTAKDASTNQPMSNVTITATGSFNGAAITDPNGGFSFTNITIGSVTITATKTGYYTVTGTGTVTAGGILFFNPALSATAPPPDSMTITGVVADALTGKPIPFSDVFVNDSSTGSGVVAAIITDSYGRYTLSGITLHEFVIGAAAIGYNSLSYSLSSTTYGAETVNFNLSSSIASDIKITSLTTDKQTYDAYDTVTITASIDNISASKMVVSAMAQFEDGSGSISDLIMNQPQSELSLSGQSSGEMILQWNTGKNSPGTYFLTLFIVDGDSGDIVAAKKISLAIRDTVRVEGLETLIFPEFVAVNSSESIQLSAYLNNRSNKDANLQAECLIRDTANAMIYSRTVDFTIKVTESSKTFECGNLVHTFNQSGQYPVEIRLLMPDGTVFSGNAAISVSPSRRIDAVKTLSPDIITPDGDKRIRINIGLNGIYDQSSPVSQPAADTGQGTAQINQQTAAFGPANLIGIKVTTANPYIKVGEKQQFSAVGIFSDMTEREMTDGGGAWAGAAHMPTPRHTPAVGFIEGKLYVAGGYNGVTRGQWLDIYDPEANAWASGPPMPTARCCLGGGVINNKLYATGGHNNTLYKRSALEVFDPSMNVWSSAAPIPQPPSYPASAVVNNKLYIIGGSLSGINSASSVLQVYDPVTNTWTTKAQMPTPRLGAQAAVIDGLIYVAGGIGPAGIEIASLEVYDTHTNTWSAKSPMSVARTSLSVSAVDGALYVTGGISSQTGGDLSINERYDPAKDEWVTVTPLPVIKRGAAGVTLGNRAYIVGGVRGSSPEIYKAEESLYVYSPSEIIWQSSNSNAASIDLNGLSIGLNPGIAVITATNGGLSGSATLRVVKTDSLVDVRVVDTVSGSGIDLDMNSFTITPYSVSTANGNSIVEWRFDSLATGQSADISFDVLLRNPLPNEDRLVNQSLEVNYTDSAGNTFKTGVDPQYVHVLNSAFDTGISIDKPAYRMGEDAAISAHIINLSEYARTMTAKVIIEDATGGLLKELSSQSITLAAGETWDIGSLTFSVGTVLAGDYKAHLLLFDNQDQVGEASADFSILPENNLILAVTTDKAAYNPNAIATIFSAIRSLSPNYIYSGLTAKVAIINQQSTGGTQIFSETRNISILLPGQMEELTSYWNTLKNPPGTYTVAIEVRDPSGAVISAATNTLTISGTVKPSKSFKGHISVDRNVILQGDPLNITYGVTNTGNMDINDAALSVKTVHVVEHTAYDTLTDNATLRMGTTVTNTKQLDTHAYTAKDYLVILRADVTGVEETLASTYFRVEGAPSVPSLYSPGQETAIETLTPSLTINNSADPNDDKLTYEFEVYSDSGLTDLLFSSGVIPEGDGTTSWQVPAALQENVRYYWRARAHDGMLYGDWMLPAEFRVNVENDPPTAPSISSPANNSSVGAFSPVLSVNNASDPDSVNLTYNFQIARDMNFTQIMASATGIFESNGATSWQVPVTLTENTRYYWRAQADDWLVTGPWMTTARFFVNTFNEAPTTPAILAPINGSEIAVLYADISATNSTDPDSSALTYIFEADTSITFDSPVLIRSGNIPGGPGTTIWHIAGLGDNTYYYVRTKTSDGMAESPWSDTVNFFVNTANDAPSIPALANPSDGSAVKVMNPTLSVYNSSDIDGDTLTYDFEIYSDAAMQQLIASVTAVLESTGTTGWVVPASLSENRIYHWRARAFDGELHSSWMQAASFMVNTANDAPGAPALSSPAAGSSLATLSPTLSINNATDPERDKLTYDFEIYSGGTLIKSFTGIQESSSDITSVTMSPALSDNTSYSWRARAYDGDRYGAWMDTANFSLHLSTGKITATIDFDPDTLNKKSAGTWVTVYIELPTMYKVSDIAVSSIKLEGTVPAEPWPYSLGDYDRDGIPDLMVKFNRDAVINLLQSGNSVKVHVSGRVGGTTFEGIDTIRVIK